MLSLSPPRTALGSPAPDPFVRLVLVVALGLGAVLRLADLGALPNGFFADEASAGYDAYAILHTGRDQYGTLLPAFARSFGDYDEASYRYLAVPAIAVLGPTVTAVRLPAALAGVATIALLFALVSRWWTPRAGALAALALAISPWHVLLSRVAFRGVLLPLAIVALLLLAHQARARPARWIATGVAAAVALWTYSPARLVVPALALVLAVLELPRLRRRDVTPLAIGIALFLGCGAALATFWLSPEGMARARNELRESGSVDLFLDSYATYFDASFLFVEGDRQLRHSFAGWGQLHVLEMLTVPIGVAVVLARHRREDLLLGAWLLLAPVPAALTTDHHALRAIGAAPAFAVLSGLGAWALLEHARRHERTYAVALAAGTLLLARSVDSLAHELHRDYRAEASAVWQWGMREIVEDLRDADAPCRVVSNRLFLPHVFVAFFAPLDPRAYQAGPVDTITQRSGAIDDWRLDGWRITRLTRAIEETPECAFAAHVNEAGALEDDPRYRELARHVDPLATHAFVVFRMDGQPPGDAPAQDGDVPTEDRPDLSAASARR